MPPKFNFFFFPPFSPGSSPGMVLLNEQLPARGQGQKERVGIELPVMSPWCSPRGLARHLQPFPGATVPVTGRAEISGSSPKDVGAAAGLGAPGFLESALSFLSQRGNGTPGTSVPSCLLVGSLSREIFI